MGRLEEGVVVDSGVGVGLWLGMGAGVESMRVFVGCFLLAFLPGLGADLTEAEFHDAGKQSVDMDQLQR